MVERVCLRAHYMRQDTVNYALDIIMLRQQPVIFKTAAFIKRNWLRFTDICGRTEFILRKVGKGIKHGVQHMAHGLKGIFKDGKWLVSAKAEGFQSKYAANSYKRHSRAREVKMDLFKFVPFSFFLIIPGAEILLPPWILIFPNSVPSQFMSDKEREQKFKEVKARQAAAAQKLLFTWPRFFSRLTEDAQISD